jgi:hypothetical protein
MRIFALFFLALWLSAASGHADGDPCVVISMREYLIEGSSRIHLYLYGMDGVFKKALTNDSGFNDLEPVFDYEGKTILFTREAADKAHETQAGQYVVEIASGTIRRYNPKNDFFGRTYPDMFDSAFAPGSKDWVNITANVYHSPDGQFTISAKPNPKPDT